LYYKGYYSISSTREIYYYILDIVS
jgi:hypothetical protein